MKNIYVGIDIGGTRIKTLVLEENGSIQEKKSISTEDTEQPGHWKFKIEEILESIALQYGNRDYRDILYGISAPGLTDHDNKRIIHMPGRLNGLENYDWSTEYEKPIYVINDAHSACLAEYETFYKDQGIKNMLMLTLGTGVGGGVIIDDKLFQGNIQRAGHFGHMTVDHKGVSTITNMVGSLEYAVGNFSVSERTHGKFSSVKDLVSAYARGESLATYWWLSSVQKLATALASLTNIFSPEIIVLGGGISCGSKNLLMNPLKEFMSLYEWQPGGHQVKIELARHEEYAGAMGAAFYAKTKMNENKS